ncbi:MAG: TonB-dependent receptor [Deltaproteobacteria bacterium]|nr:TonB-dependent receptor [Deltaproteobacteria bacterium]
MINIRLLFVATLVTMTLNASAALAESGFDLSLSAGYRRDTLDWNIAGDTSGANPNILSELAWKNIKSEQLKLTGKANIKDVVVVRGYADYGWIYSGENQDSDYLADNRAGEYSRSNNRSDSGNVSDYSIGGGFPARYASPEGIIQFAPMVGWSQHRQNLRITDGYQTIPATGAFKGLDSSYKARWHGPWYGVDLGYKHPRFTVSGAFEYHFQSKFYATANWNLRGDFQHPRSFEHFADGKGRIGSLDAAFVLTKRISLIAEARYQKWRAENGIDRTYFSNGVIADTRLNEVNWTSYDLMAGAMLSL